MKVKRVLCIMLIACMVVPLLYIAPASAAVEWTYEAYVAVCDKKDAQCSKKNAITVKWTFDGTDETAFLQDTDKRNGLAYAKLKSSRAPWTLDSVTIENSTKDSLWMSYCFLYVGSSVGNAIGIESKFWGDPKDDATGVPIDVDDGGPKSRTIYFDARRKVDMSALDDFSDKLFGDIRLNPKGESGTIKNEWSGKVFDNYNVTMGKKSYYCMDLSDPPTLSVSVSGMKGDGSQVSKSELEKNGIKFLDRGYEMDKSKVLSYMNNNNLNEIDLLYTLKFSSKSTSGQTTFYKTTRIFRNAFSLGSVDFSKNYYKAGNDNYFYNNQNDKTITVTANIKTTDNYNMFGGNVLNKAEVSFDNAYIKVGDQKIYASDSSGNKVKSTTVYSGNMISLAFPYSENMDSDNKGITLVLENARIETGEITFWLWDEVRKKIGFSNQDNFDGYYKSTHKIDSTNPTIAVAPADGVDLSKWNKTVTLKTTASEDIQVNNYFYSMIRGWEMPKGYYAMYLTNGVNSPAIYKYNYTEENKGTAAYIQKVPALKDYTQNVTLALRDKVEGEYDLVFSGTDYAGNKLSTVYKGIKLDNKAPEITLTEKQKPKTDGRKGNVYNVKISDASGTGRLYYMFTQKSVADAPEYDGSNNPTTSGDMDTTLDRWAYIEQKDTENGNTAAAYIDVEKGKNFVGRLMYFALDEAGNKTDVYSKDINIQNEDTAYDITPKNVDKPQPSYNISVTTNNNNTVWYRWKNYIVDEKTGKLKENYITDFKQYTGIIDTSKDDATKNINGTYILECKIVPPSNTNINYVSVNYAFDNEGPVINMTAPSEESYSKSQTVSVYATDMSDVASAKAKIVTPDGNDIDGNEEFNMNVAGGILSQNVNISDIPSGAYALKVTATDTNGFSTTETSNPFFIRNEKPTGTVNVASDLIYNEKSLIADENIKLDFDISEEFANSSYAKGQSLYYRMGTASGEYGDWIKAGEITSDENGLKVAATVDAPSIALVDGENTIFVQTAICHENADKSKIDLGTVKEDEIIFYYDNIAPNVDLVINDEHTRESIEGKLYVRDNLDTAFTVTCENSAVKIGEFKDGAYDITVSENADTDIIVSDTAGNQKSVKLVIKGIDRVAPTVDIKTAEKSSGARKDATATVKVNDVLGVSVKFAFIPTDKYTGGAIPEEYFSENITDDGFYIVSEARSEKAAWSNENNITYNVQVAGISGSRYLGVRAADSLGNTTDIVFKDNVLSAEDAVLSAVTTANPMKTETRTVAQVKYNVPVYTLPQDKILNEQSDIVKNNTLGIDGFDSLTASEKIEAANLELAKQYAMAYSDTYTFAVTANGGYDLYTVDDLGRTKHLIAEVRDVEFGAASDIKAGIYKKQWNESSECEYVPVPVGEMICAAAYGENAVIIEPADNNNDTLLLPKEELDGVYKNGLTFDSSASRDYAVYADGTEDIKGYTKLIYNVGQIMLENTDIYRWNESLSEVTERIVTVLAFNKDANTENPDEVSEKSTVITGIDNTEPIVTWSVSPEILTYELAEFDGEMYYDWVTHTTPGNVTYTINAQDKESGIEKIVALYYEKADGSEEEVVVPETDEDGNPTEYWSWDGSNYTEVRNVWDEEQQDYVQKSSTIPVKVEYYGDGDKFGVKTLKFTFTDSYRLLRAGVFFNTLGADGSAIVGRFESGLSTEGIIYKMPIEEGKDYNIKYYFENSKGEWEEISDTTNQYYKNAKAVVEIDKDSRGAERGLYVLNNAGVSEKILNNYQNTFTFNLKDKYGYTKEVPVSLENFDINAGTIDYELAVTSKTNKPYDITINVSDEKSGVGTVKLTSGADEISLNKVDEGKYKGVISKNGTYSITMYDNVGNKAVKSFNIKNINTEVPTANVEYSTKECTSRPVTATLTFSKPNVRITNIEPVSSLSESDYTVNYNTSVITFTKSGTVAVCFEDDYGNSNENDVLVVAVDNIEKVPPVLEAVMDNTTDPSVVAVTFNKVDNLTSKMDMERKDTDIFVNYGGITKTVADVDGNKNSFTFYQNGNYTFKVYDKEGLSSYLSVEITGIDTKAPKITSVSWSYDYDEFDGATWVTKTANETKVPVDGTVGYIVAADKYNVTNQDVTVKVETDDDTRLVGSSDDYTKTKESVYTKNGLFIFNTEKNNGLTASYGLDIEVIDKTPPTIDLLGTDEMVFYENPQMNTDYDISMLKYVENGKYEAYKAYDVFNGKKTDLTANVEIADWGGFNPNDLSQNTFDSSKPYTITYRVTDSAHNVTEVKRTVRLVGMYDTVALVNGSLPDFAGRSEVLGDSIKISLANFAGTAYVRYQSGVKTMGQMKKDGIMLSQNADGDFEATNLEEGWYTFYIQTDKRDYFTLCVYLSK